MNSLRFAIPVSKESREQTPAFLQVLDGSHLSTGDGETCITPAGSDPLLHPPTPFLRVEGPSDWRCKGGRYSGCLISTASRIQGNVAGPKASSVAPPVSLSFQTSLLGPGYPNQSHARRAGRRRPPVVCSPASRAIRRVPSAPGVCFPALG